MPEREGQGTAFESLAALRCLESAACAAANSFGVRYPKPLAYRFHDSITNRLDPVQMARQMSNYNHALTLTSRICTASELPCAARLGSLF